MAVVRKTGGKWWSVIESVELSALRELDLHQTSVYVRYSRGALRSTCLSKALISFHLAKTASSSFGKSIDMA